MPIFTKEILEQGRGKDGNFNDIQYRKMKIYEYKEENLLNLIGKDIHNGRIQRFIKYTNFHIKHKNYNTPKGIKRSIEIREHRAKKNHAKKERKFYNETSQYVESGQHLELLKKNADKITVIKKKKIPENLSE